MRMAALLFVAAACGNHHGSGADATSPLPFRCGAMICGANQFCLDAVSGVTSAAPALGCNDLPSACVLAPTCDCVMTNVNLSGVGVSCPVPTCSAVDHAVTVVCSAP
jgi:hypothetical protein